MAIMVIRRLREVALDSGGWWEKLDSDQQSQYISEHPNSKFAKNAKDTEFKDNSDKEPEKKGTLKKAVDTVKKVGKAVHEWDVKETEEIKNFLGGDTHKPGSNVRRSMGEKIKDKAAGFVKHLGKEAKEHAHALRALAKMPVSRKGWKDIPEHDKKALKSIGISLGIFAGTLVATGGIGSILHAAAHHGASSALQHLGMHYVQEVVTTSAARAAVFASDEPSDKDILTKLAKGFADYLENGDIDWGSVLNGAETVKDSDKEKPETTSRVLARLKETAAEVPSSKLRIDPTIRPFDNGDDGLVARYKKLVEQENPIPKLSVVYQKTEGMYYILGLTYSAWYLASIKSGLKKLEVEVVDTVKTKKELLDLVREYND